LRSIVTKFLVLLLAAAWQPGHASGPMRTLLVFGDSLSAGFGVEPNQTWVALLQERLQAKGYGYRVVNASISGDTTSGGLNRLSRSLRNHQPSIILIELGGNDGLRATPIAVIRDNLSRMIGMAQVSGVRVVLAGMRMPPNYGDRYTDEFARIYPELARKHGVALISFMLDGVALDKSLMQADGIHPNAAGQPKLLDNAWPAIEREIEATLPPAPAKKPAPAKAPAGAISR
jgi:acyl-CoA thioesterase-1